MNLGMLGLLGGIGQGISQAGSAWGAGMNEAAKEERALITQQKLLQFKDDMDEAKRQRIAGQVRLGAQAIADERANAQTGILDANRQASDEIFPSGMASSGTEGASPVTPVKGLVTPIDSLTAMAQVDPMTHTKDLAAVVSNERLAAANAQHTANESRRLDITEQRNEDRATNEAEQRRIDRGRLEAMFAKIDKTGNGKEEKPVYPKLVKEVDDENKPYVIDQNTGAIGRMKAGTPAKDSVWHLLKPNEPATPETLSKMEWTDSEGNPLPGGISSLYKANPGPAKADKASAPSAISKTDALFPKLEKKAEPVAPKAEPVAATAKPAAAPEEWINRGMPFKGEIYGGGSDMFQEQINKGTGEIRKVRVGQLAGLLSTPFGKNK